MIEFVGETFESTEDIQKRFESIRDTAPLKEPLQGTEHKMVMKLLQAHPRYKEKIGPGISALTVDLHPEFKTTRRFHYRPYRQAQRGFQFSEAVEDTTSDVNGSGKRKSTDWC